VPDQYYLFISNRVGLVVVGRLIL